MTTENISADVKQILNQKYPNDKATGYQIDDLRGAVSIQKTLIKREIKWLKNIHSYVVPTITSIQDMLLRSAKVYGDKLALEDLSSTPISKLTFKELHDYVIRFGKALFEIGIKERDHIAVISDNRVQWSLTYFTSMCFNMVIVPIDKNLNQNEILNIIHESEAKAIVFSESFEPLMKEKRDSLLNLKYYINMDSKEHETGILSMTKMINAQSATIEKLPSINPDAMAEIIFTSGSLGRAKGVMLSQKNIASNLMAMTSMIQITPDDRFLSVLPIHHKYECTCGLLCPLYAGASAHYARSLKTVVDDLQKVKATILLGVPLLYDKMFKKIHKGITGRQIKIQNCSSSYFITNIFESFGWKSSKKLIFKELHHKFGGHIRLFIAGGAAPDPKVAKGLRELGFNFVQGYGLTETSPIVALKSII